jgi:hypothetical protein
MKTTILTKEEICNLNSSVSIKETKSINGNLPKEKSPGPDGFTCEFYQTCKKEFIRRKLRR